MDSTKKRKFTGIQALRGIAACMVVILHASSVYSQRRGGWVWNNGASGVDIFFVISGFVMAVSFVEKEGLTAGKFLQQRIIRVVPLYWLMTSLMVFALGFSNRAPAPVSCVLSSLLFIPHSSPTGDTLPILAQGWTLSLEMVFYLLFSLAIYLKIHPAKFLTLSLCGIAAVGLMRNDSWPAATKLFDPLVLEFLFGFFMGYRTRNYSAVLGVGGFVLLCCAPSGFRPICWGVPAFLLVQWAVQWKSIPAIFTKIGDASYSLYLSHVLVVLVVFRMLPELPESVFIAACLVSSIVGSMILYQFIEKPIMNRLKSPQVFTLVLQRVEVVSGTPR